MKCTRDTRISKKNYRHTVKIIEHDKFVWFLISFNACCNYQFAIVCLLVAVWKWVLCFFSSSLHFCMLIKKKEFVVDSLHQCCLCHAHSCLTLIVSIMTILGILQRACFNSAIGLCDCANAKPNWTMNHVMKTIQCLWHLLLLVSFSSFLVAAKTLLYAP